ncbi:MAG: sugar phosphate isomerase/epimerase family protein [Desulfohalobiaceae bacterium]
MGRCFVNLPVRYIAEDSSYLDYFLQKGLNPELGLDPIALDHLEESWHQELAGILRDHGLFCSIHLPFHDLQPGSLDDLILQATRERLRSSLRIAAIYQPRYLVGHANFIPLYSNLFSRWLARAAETWRQTLQEWNKAAPLYLENVREQDPRPLSDLLAELSEYRVNFCFDLGHWASYGGGSQYQNLSHWIQTMGPYLRHLHLHDNDCIADQHFGLGQGNIAWVELFAGLEILELTPTFTLEPHTKEDLEYSWKFMQKHFPWFSRLGLRKQELSKL